MRNLLLVNLAFSLFLPTAAQCRGKVVDEREKILVVSGGDVGNGPKGCTHPLPGANPDFDEGEISACEEMDIGSKELNAPNE